MSEISAASSEQSAGVAQVGEAVNQMDRATQQNAALVEQSAAEAETSKGQAQQLVQAVAVFKLAHTEAVDDFAAAPPASQASVERCGPERARNVARPAFGTKAKANANAEEIDDTSVTAPAAKTGTDDWLST